MGRVVPPLVGLAWRGLRDSASLASGPRPKTWSEGTPGLHDHPSTLGLVGDAIAQVSGLVGSEVRLARAELGERMSSALTAMVSVVGAAVFLIVALIFLLQALVAWLTERGWPASVSNLAVGAALFVAAVAAIALALRRLTSFQLMPSRAVDQARKSVAVVKGKVAI